MNPTQNSEGGDFPGSIKPAVICLLLANALPAFKLGGDMVWGWMASCLEFLALFQPNLEQGQRPAAFMGLIANLGYLVSFFAIQTHRPPLAKRSAAIATLAAFASVAFLVTSGDSVFPGPGCLLWLITGVMLVRETP